jgi:transcriptional regulator with XRE-family HTH domain
MLAKRLKQLRLARGFTLDELSAATGGFVTKQAISKYELGKSNPSPAVVTRLAGVLGVKGADLLFEPEYRVQLIAYRRTSRMSVKAQETVESSVACLFEDRLRVQQLLGMKSENLPIRSLPVKSLEDADEAAKQVRHGWGLGLAPIGNLIGLLEDQCIHVIDTEAVDGFDGLSVVAEDSETGRPWSAAVAITDGVTGDRQRFNIAHELGHLVMAPTAGVDEEKAAHRFAGALLAPAEALRRELGVRRQSVYLEELKNLKERYGISIGALSYGMLNAGIVTGAYHQLLWRELSRLGWRKREPGNVPLEKSGWLTNAVLRATAEGMLGAEEAERLLGYPVAREEDLSTKQRKAIRCLPVEAREHLLEHQAEKLAKFYTDDGPLDMDTLAGDYE